MKKCEEMRFDDFDIFARYRMENLAIFEEADNYVTDEI